MEKVNDIQFPINNVGTNAIIYQGLQRVFRNAIVVTIRKGLSNRYPSDHIQRLKNTFGSQWEKIEQNANESRRLGGTFTQPIDDYDLLDINCFFQVFDSHFDILFPKGTDRPSKPKLLGNLKQITDSRNPLSHPVEQDIAYDEAISVLMDAKQVLHMLTLDSAVTEISKLIRETFDVAGKKKDRPLSVLPTQDSVYFEFVGRNAILKNLGLWYADPNNRRGLLEGAGGKGKSAIAYRFAQQIVATSEDYKLVGWISAKKRRFLSGKTVGIDQPDFVDIQSAIDSLLLQYGMLASDLMLPLIEKRTMLLGMMDEYPAFIIADDIDSVLDDQLVTNFLTYEVPHTKSAILITSRISVPGVKNFVVNGFTLPEAEIFIANRTRLYGIDQASMSPQAIRCVREVTDSSPLYIDDLMRLARATGIAKAAEMWSTKQGEAARKYALEQELNQLGQDARRALIATCVNEQPVSFLELQDILGISEERLSDALRSLQVLFLMPTPTVIEGDERYAINQNTRRLVFEVEGSSDTLKRIENKSKALQGKLPHVARAKISAQIRQAYLLSESGRLTEAEDLIKSAIEKFENEGDLYGFLGYLYKRHGKIADARIAFQHSLKLNCPNPDTHKHWVRLEMAEQEWTKAIEAADKALKVRSDNYEIHQLRAEAKCRLGIDLKRRRQDEKAEKLLREATDELKSVLKSPESLNFGEREISSEMYKTIVICHDWLQDMRELNHWFIQWRAEHPGDSVMERQKDWPLLAVYFAKTAKIEIETRIKQTPANAGVFYF